MRELPRVHFAARILMIVLWGGLSLLIPAAPYLAAHSHRAVAAFIYLMFSGICHQIPQRSFSMWGHNLGVCQRCFGIYFGIFATSLLPLPLRFVFESARRRKGCILASAAPLILDAILPKLGLWTGTATSRFATGLVFGSMLSPLMLVGISEFIAEAAWRPADPLSSQSKGDIS
jgi:uncharacterized membrane protein